MAVHPAAVRFLTGASLVETDPSVAASSQVVHGFGELRRLRRRLAREGRACRSYALLRSGGTVRWVLPCSRRVLLRQAFAAYTPSTRQGRRAWSVFRMLAALGLFPVPGTEFLVLSAPAATPFRAWREFLRSHMPQAGELADLDLALHLGAPRRKFPLFTALLIEPGKGARAAVKVAGSSDGDAVIVRETEVLGRLAALNLRTGSAPRILHAGPDRDGRHFLMTDVGPTQWSPADFRLTKAHARFLVELAEKSGRPVSWQGSAAQARLRRDVAFLEGRVSAGDAGRLTAVADAIDGTWANMPVPLSLAHGDFVPWNCRTTGTGLYVFDWEYARDDVTPLWDAFDFLMHTGVNEAAAIVRKVGADPAFSAFLRKHFPGAPEQTVWPALGAYAIGYMRRFCEDFSADTRHLAPWRGMMPAVLDRLPGAQP